MITRIQKRQKTPTEKMSPWVKREWRRLNRIITKGNPQSDALERRYLDLEKVFRSASASLNPVLIDKVAGALSDSALFGDLLMAKFRELNRLGKRVTPERVRSILLDIEESVVKGQLRQVRVLLRAIPLMRKHLEAQTRRRSRRRRARNVLRKP